MILGTGGNGLIYQVLTAKFSQFLLQVGFTFEDR